MKEETSYIICDLDGTLCNLNHRKYLIENEKKDWDKFYSLVGKDKIYHHIKMLVQTYPVARIVFLTGRPFNCADVTNQWLQKNIVNHHSNWDLYMRKAGDYRKDSVIKKEIYLEQIEPKYGEPLLILEDRNQVVEMWRSLGLNCLQVADGDF